MAWSGLQTQPPSGLRTPQLGSRAGSRLLRSPGPGGKPTRLAQASHADSAATASRLLQGIEGKRGGRQFHALGVSCTLSCSYAVSYIATILSGEVIVWML